jgi:hypothetical protein
VLDEERGVCDLVMRALESPESPDACHSDNLAGTVHAAAYNFAYNFKVTSALPAVIVGTWRLWAMKMAYLDGGHLLPFGDAIPHL